MQSSKVQALPCPAKGEKKARQKLLTKLARRSLIESSSLLSTKPSANDGDLPRANAPQKALSIAKLRPAQGSMAFALTPLKRRPCGGCEALKGGLCQCALKLAKRRAG
ncbi:hypothetical protein KJI95_01250 [Shewanella sp. JM162201]|uniref:Uncharacterized protein n=1 Tax=Shewanella jiangmenensis TaxID=2837387 RepID=A0ABS5V078_9GAMM|nr:hypothetical protein [Shewanella jiangmenensis]MBT1443156.1 hypothetical protein [Shewanella jiangmenensis]